MHGKQHRVNQVRDAVTWKPCIQKQMVAAQPEQGRRPGKLVGEHLECSPCGGGPGASSNNPLRMVAKTGGAAVALAKDGL
jgi:hypothetical protein